MMIQVIIMMMILIPLTSSMMKKCFTFQTLTSFFVYKTCFFDKPYFSSFALFLDPLCP